MSVRTDEYQPRTAERLVEILKAQDQNPRSWQREAARMIEQSRADVMTVLANLHYLEEVTGERIEGEDSIILRQIEKEHGMDIEAERANQQKARPEK